MRDKRLLIHQFFHGEQDDLRRVLVGVELLIGLSEVIVAQQDDINAAVSSLQELGTNLDATATRIEQKIADLQAANPGIDTSALTAEVADLRSHVDAVGNIVPVVEATDTGTTDTGTTDTGTTDTGTTGDVSGPSVGAPPSV